MPARCTGGDVIRLGESVYHLASSGNRSSGDKTTSAQLVRRCISEQLQNVLGNNDAESIYVAPVSGGSSQLAASPRIENISYNTLTRVVREELRKFTEAAAAHSPHQQPASDVLETSCSAGNKNVSTRSGKRTGDYEEIDDVIDAIAERDHLISVAVRSDEDVPAPRHSPPPPPPQRLSASSTASATTRHNDDSRPAMMVASQRPADSAETTVRQRRAQVDNERVIALLTRIEQSTAELDASFTALVNVGLRCPGDWQRLARQLPICRPAKLARHVARIEERYRDDVKQQAAAALAEWRSYRRSQATLGELVDALKRCDLREEARFLDSMPSQAMHNATQV